MAVMLWQYEMAAKLADAFRDAKSKPSPPTTFEPGPWVSGRAASVPGTRPARAVGPSKSKSNNACKTTRPRCHVMAERARVTSPVAGPLPSSISAVCHYHKLLSIRDRLMRFGVVIPDATVRPIFRSSMALTTGGRVSGRSALSSSNTWHSRTMWRLVGPPGAWSGPQAPRMGPAGVRRVRQRMQGIVTL